FHAAYADVVEEALREAGPRREACIAAPGPSEPGLPTPRAPGFTSYDELLRSGDPDAPPSVRGGGFGGVMVYTSGTTGRAKGARRDFRRTGMEPVLNFMAGIPLRRDERHL